MESVIVPVIKNKNKLINDKGNYRPTSRITGFARDSSSKIIYISACYF